MKKLISLVAVMGILVTGFSQFRSSYPDNRYNNNMKPGNSLVIDTRGMKDFVVYVDNQEYQSNGDALTINSLYSGNHRVVIYEKRRQMFGLVGREKKRLLYNSTLRLKPGIETSVLVNRNGTADVTEHSIYNGNRRDNNGSMTEGITRITGTNKNVKFSGYTLRAGAKASAFLL